MRSSYRVTKEDFKTPAEKCAREIIEWLLKDKNWIDVSIYVNNKRYSCYNSDEKEIEYNYDYRNTWDAVYCEDDINVGDYIEYHGDFLTMSFDGGSNLYEIFNYYEDVNYCDKKINEFNKIISKYKKFYELGYAWSLSLYDI